MLSSHAIILSVITPFTFVHNDDFFIESKAIWSALQVMTLLGLWHYFYLGGKEWMDVQLN